MKTLLLGFALAAACGQGGEQCSAFGTACPKGGTIESCCTATACHYKTSDGMDFPCAGTLCMQAETMVKTWCQAH